MPLLPTDETRICPYDRTHEILVTRWERHLLRCRPQHPNSGVVICKFNWQHHIPKEEIAYHERECAKEVMNQGNTTPMDPSFIIPDPMANHKAGLVTEVDPEWEQEVAPYDPTAVAMSKPVIRLFQNMPKKARREARAKDRLRIQALLEEEERNKAAAAGGGPDPEKMTPRTLRQPGDEETRNGDSLAGGMSSLEISNATSSRITTTGESAYDKYLRINENPESPGKK